MVHFDECEHKWSFQTNAGNNTSIWRTTFACRNCNQIITLEEKCALEQTEIAKKGLQDQIDSGKAQLRAQEKSLKIQEKNLRIAMWAMIISAVSSFIALCVFLFGDKTLFF